MVIDSKSSTEYHALTRQQSASRVSNNDDDDDDDDDDDFVSIVADGDTYVERKA